MENKNKIINEANKMISGELVFLNGYYEYDLKRYYLPGLIYGSSYLTFFNLEEAKYFSLDETIRINNYCKNNCERNIIHANIYKILNLIAGFELLGIGINIHGIAEGVIKNMHNKKKGLVEDHEKNYTLKLLFGDIFYSRAVIYLINYDNFFLFEDILNSLLVLHNSRLIIHQMLVNLFTQNFKASVYKRFGEVIYEIKNLNALLKSAFLAGFAASDFKLNSKESSLSFRMIDNLVSFKTYSDIENHLGLICCEERSDAQDRFFDFIFSKKAEISEKIDRDIAAIEPIWLKNNFNGLVELFRTS
ncbi:MAG: hypothetical protein PHR39_04240 [Actinomycetota bacterium]|nr:hypothetical protein [Actinomycetota bacterium]